MGRLLDFTLLVLAFQVVATFGQLFGQSDQSDQTIPDEEVDTPSTSPNLNVFVSASFPDSEIFGIKLINGKPTDASLSFSNEETEPVTVQFVGGSLWTPDFDVSGSRIVRNLTTKQYAVEIAPGEKQSLPFTFQTNMHPQELRLNLAAMISQEQTYYTVQAFNGTVAIVDPDTSLFDPQIIFLYIFLLACTAGIGYFFYTIWIAPYFPQKRQSAGRRAAATPKKIDAGAKYPENDGPASSTGVKAYNEEWIPSHHLARPEARRLKSGGRPKSRSGNKD